MQKVYKDCRHCFSYVLFKYYEVNPCFKLQGLGCRKSPELIFMYSSTIKLPSGYIYIYIYRMFILNDEGNTVKCQFVLVMWPVESLFSLSVNSWHIVDSLVHGVGRY